MARLIPIHEHKSRYHVPALLNTPWLRFRGWSTAMIRRFAGAPDETQPNPRYPRGPPQKFYSKSRIEKIEKTEEFIKVRMRSRRIKGGRNRKEVREGHNDC